jgi:hypothetical protein
VCEKCAKLCPPSLPFVDIIFFPCSLCFALLCFDLIVKIRRLVLEKSQPFISFLDWIGLDWNEVRFVVILFFHAFTRPRHVNQRTWLYRQQPSVIHNPQVFPKTLGIGLEVRIHTSRNLGSQSPAFVGSPLWKKKKKPQKGRIFVSGSSLARELETKLHLLVLLSRFKQWRCGLVQSLRKAAIQYGEDQFMQEMKPLWLGEWNHDHFKSRYILSCRI